jgi:flagellar basal body rod protein FlgF
VTYTTTQSGGATGFAASGSGNINNTVTMPPASKITYKATGTISASATGSISDTTTVTAPSGVTDPNTANNSATDTDTL